MDRRRRQNTHKHLGLWYIRLEGEISLILETGNFRHRLRWVVRLSTSRDTAKDERQERAARE